MGYGNFGFDVSKWGTQIIRFLLVAKGNSDILWNEKMSVEKDENYIFNYQL